MHSAERILCFLATTIAVSGCTPTFVDSSSSEPYKSRLGQVCTSSLPLRAHGVANTVEREKKTDAVLVTQLRLSGPEFTFAEALPPQTSLRLVSAQECSNCFLEAQARFLVTVSPPVALATDVPVFVRAEAVASGVLECK